MHLFTNQAWSLKFFFFKNTIYNKRYNKVTGEESVNQQRTLCTCEEREYLVGKGKKIKKMDA